MKIIYCIALTFFCTISYSFDGFGKKLTGITYDFERIKNSDIKDLDLDCFDEGDLNNSPYSTSKFIKRITYKDLDSRVKEVDTSNETESVHTCFSGETLISTPNGEVPIENIQPGNKIYAYDVEKNQVVTAEVEARIYYGKKITCRLSAENDNSVRVTPTHPFYTRKSLEKPSFTALFNIMEDGGSLFTLASSKREGNFSRVESFTSPRREKIYTLVVKKYRNYFANGFLVHNGYVKY